MKRCPECRRDYYDDTLLYCLDDGNALLEGPASGDEPATAILSEPPALAGGTAPSEFPTRAQINTTDQTAILRTGAEAEPQNQGGLPEKQSFSANRAAKPQGKVGSWPRQLAVVGIAVIILVGGFFGYRYFSPAKQIESIAVMPFVNESGNADVAKVEKTYTANPEAYQLYLKGRYQWNRRTPESLKQAVEFFDQAVSKDPNYALAYSALAETYVLFPNYSVAMPMDSMPKAKAAALRAIELDDSLAETHTALGQYYSLFAWNQPAAEKEFRRAIELNPNYAAAHQQFGIECLTASGRFDEAVAESRRAVEIDPVSPIIAADFGNVLFRARRFDEALAQLNRALALDPNFWVTRWYMGQAYHAKGQYAEAVAEYQKARASNDNPWVKAQLIRSLARSGRRDEAIKLLAELQSDAARRVVSSASLALAYGALGERDKAFAFLDKEITERNSRPPVLPSIRSGTTFATTRVLLI